MTDTQAQTLGNTTLVAAEPQLFVSDIARSCEYYTKKLGFAVAFLEEIWSRNIANLMMSPLRPAELAVSLMIMSFVRLVIGTVPVTILAALVFGFNVYGLGLGVAAFFANLVLTGWAIGAR